MSQEFCRHSKLKELENSVEVEEYKKWRSWAQLFYSRMMSAEEDANEILKRAEEGYLKTNPVAKEYLILKRKHYTESEPLLDIKNPE